MALIKQYCKQEKIKGLLVGVDARKAFDSVDHEYEEHEGWQPSNGGNGGVGKNKKKTFWSLDFWTGH